MSIAFTSFLDLNFHEQAELFNRCFEDYIVPLKLSPEMAAGRIRREGIDLVRSFIAEQDGQPVAVVLIAPRAKRARLAGMGVVKSARGQGLGKICMEEFLRRLREDGYELGTLEVFEQNTSAVRLYTSFGFRETGKLIGYTGAPFSSGAQRAKEARITDYIGSLTESPDPLPWVQEAEQISTTTLPMRCYTVDGSAYALVAACTGNDAIRVGSLYVVPAHRRAGKGTELLRAIQALYPGQSWAVPQVLPGTMEPFFLANGFTREALNQIEMALELSR